MDNRTLNQKICDAIEIIDRAVEKYKPIAVYGLFSGGDDSLTSLGIAARSKAFTCAAHINTGIGIEETREFVRETCQREGWGLKEYKAAENKRADGKPDPMIYKDLVRKYGFPGPPGHSLMYNKLKERPLRMLIRDTKKGHPRRSHVILVTGCRSQESLRRMGNVTPEDKRGSSVWLNPIHDWSKQDCLDFIEWAKYPRNPVSQKIHKSGECLCVAEGTLVRTWTGWSPIENVEVSTIVQTATGFESVHEVHDNGVADTLRIKPYFLPELIATEDHPILAVPYSFTGHRGKKVVGTPEWVKAGDLYDQFLWNKGKSVSKQRKHYVVRDFSQREKALRLSDDQLDLLGYFMSEGAYNWRKDKYRNGPGGLVFTVSGTHKESIAMADDIERILKALFKTAHRREWTDVRTGRRYITVRNLRRASSDFVQRFIHGRYCTEKFFSEAVMGSSINQQYRILEKMWIGDGSNYDRPTGEQVSAYGTSSFVLAIQVQELLLRRGEVFGINSSPSSTSPTGRSYLVRRSSNQALRYGVLEYGCLYAGIQNISSAGNHPVRNLTVRNDPSFSTPSGIVHNCGAFAKQGELDELRVFFPEVAKEIDDLYAEVRAQFPWDWEGRPPKDKGKAKPAGPLCTSCDKQAEEDGVFDGDVVTACQVQPKD